MSLARTSPTLRMRIHQQQAWTTIPADTSGATRPRRVTSYAELYRGTEYDTRLQLPAMPAGPSRIPIAPMTFSLWPPGSREVARFPAGSSRF